MKMLYFPLLQKICSVEFFLNITVHFPFLMRKVVQIKVGVTSLVFSYQCCKLKRGAKQSLRHVARVTAIDKNNGCFKSGIHFIIQLYKSALVALTCFFFLSKNCQKMRVTGMSHLKIEPNLNKKNSSCRTV